MQVVGNVIEKDNEEHEVERMQKLENLMLGVLQKEVFLHSAQFLSPFLPPKIQLHNYKT